MKNIIIHELQQFIYGLRLPIAMSIALLMFAASSITYIGEYDETVKGYRELAASQEKQLREKAKNATTVVISRREYQLPPRSNGFISDCGESNMPNTLVYTAFNFLRFSNSISKSNPLLMPSNRINWGFILTVLFSFLAVIFSFDAVSGEKERRTLALSLSNPVKRSYILFGKFIAVNILLTVCAVAGSLLALAILMFSPSVNITGETFSEIGLFLLFTVFFTGSMSAVGLFASVTCSSSNISLLMSVSLWLLFLIAVPNIANIAGMAIVPVEKISTMMTKIEEKQIDLEKSVTDPKKWSSNGGDPFYAPHEVRANMRMSFDKNEGEFRDAHYAAQFRQVETTRLWTWISPLAVFEYGMEALLNGGYLRLKHNYNDLQNFKIQYLQWFKDIDAKDDKSPHWYNPAEDLSMTRKPVAYEDIPQYVESASTAARFAETFKYLAVMFVYMGVMFVIAVIRFERYDVR